jgi:hypothetical protein
MEQTPGRGNADRWIRVMETFFDHRQYGQGEFSQGFGRVETRLGLLILEERLEDRERLFVGCCAQGLSRGGPHRRIWMTCKVGRHENRTVVAQS